MKKKGFRALDLEGKERTNEKFFMLEKMTAKCKITSLSLHLCCLLKSFLSFENLIGRGLIAQHVVQGSSDTCLVTKTSFSSYMCIWSNVLLFQIRQGVEEEKEKKGSCAFSINLTLCLFSTQLSTAPHAEKPQYHTLRLQPEKLPV